MRKVNVKASALALLTIHPLLTTMSETHHWVHDWFRSRHNERSPGGRRASSVGHTAPVHVRPGGGGRPGGARLQLGRHSGPRAENSTGPSIPQCRLVDRYP